MMVLYSSVKAWCRCPFVCSERNDLQFAVGLIVFEMIGMLSHNLFQKISQNLTLKLGESSRAVSAANP
jgi:hypothetical protein